MQHPQLASVIGSTASHATFKEVQKQTVELDLHCHWLALKLYSVFRSPCIRDGARIEVKINDEFTEAISILSLSRMVSAYQSIAGSHITRGGKEEEERAVTAQLARELDRYLFPDVFAAKAGFYHQFPFYGRSERGDGMVLLEEGGLVKDKKSPLVYDFKPSNLKRAKEESIAYISREIQVHTQYPVSLCFFPTCSDIIFGLILNLEKKIGIAEICQVAVSDTEHMKKLFIALRAGIKYLLKCPISYSDSTICPRIDLSFGNKSILSRCGNYRAFRSENFVYKLFDTESGEKPNAELLKSTGYFEDVTVTQLSSDGRFLCLTYKYIEGKVGSYNASPQKFAAVAKTLKVLHDKGYVHSDVRDANVVFGNEQDAGYLVDFDLADKEGTRYPDSYNSASIAERHPTAWRGNPRRYIHDIHALQKLIKKYLGLDLERVGDLDSIIDSLST